MMEMHRDKSGKVSSKRVWGSVLLGTAVLITVASGLGWYNPEVSLVTTMFYSGAGILGIGVFEKQ